MVLIRDLIVIMLHLPFGLVQFHKSHVRMIVEGGSIKIKTGRCLICWEIEFDGKKTWRHVASHMKKTSCLQTTEQENGARMELTQPHANH